MPATDSKAANDLSPTEIEYPPFVTGKTLCSVTLLQPSRKPGLDMSLRVKVASLVSDVVYARTFSCKDLSELCPVIGAIPSLILTILKETPVVTLTEEFSVAHLHYKFKLYMNEPSESYVSTQIKHQCVLELNIGESDVRRAVLAATCEKLKTQEATLSADLAKAQKINAQLRADLKKLRAEKKDSGASQPPSSRRKRTKQES